MIQIKIINNKGFHWYIKGNIYAKGFIHSSDNVLYEEENLCNYFKNINNIQDLIKKVSDANGLFSVIIKLDDGVIAAVDRLRTFPLFYKSPSHNNILSDNPEEIISSGNLKNINPQNELEFLSTGIVCGKNTLITDLLQVQAGACVTITDRTADQIFYHTYVTSEVSSKSYAKLTKEFQEILHFAFNRFVESLKGRTLLLSLSGGYDSRLIAVMLKKMEFNDVLCYSYGNPNNKETKISHTVAQKLGYDWQFIDYKEVVDKNYIIDPVFQEYYPYAATYTSMFFLEQYFAVKFLKDSRTIPDNAIFCAGHSGDVLGGSQLTKNGNIKEYASIDKIVRSIFEIKYSQYKIDKQNKHIFLENIREYLPASTSNSNTLAYSIFENWDLKEKFAKFIFNSAVVYNYFGYEHRLPLMDNVLSDFFKMVPYKFRLYKKLYDDVLKHTFFKPYNLNFENELQPTKNQIFLQNIKNKIHPFMSSKWRDWNRIKNDQMYHYEITDVLTKDAEQDGLPIELSGKTFNPVIIQWYLHQVRKKFL